MPSLKTYRRALLLGGATLLVLMARQLLAQSETTAPVVASPVPSSASVPAPRRVASYVGVLMAERSLDVMSRVDGLLVDVSVRLGDHVETDAVVARIDVPHLRQQLDLARAAYAGALVDVDRAQAEVVEAERQATYKARLFKEGVGSSEEIELAKYHHKVSLLRVRETRARVEERRAAVEQLKKDQEAAVIRAPFAGVVAARYVEPGSHVAPLARIIRIVAQDKPFLRFAIPGSDASRFPVGTAVRAEIDTLHASLSGKVIAVAPEVDAASNMLVVEASIAVDGAGALTAAHGGELVHVTLEAEPDAARP